MSFIETIDRRGLLFQRTAEEPLDRHLAGASRIAYCGFDPTSTSLTIGNLVPINLLAHWQAAGHTPVVLMGGATGLIGDPSGKDAERQLRTKEEVEANVEAIRPIFESLLDFDPARPNAARLVNNLDWFQSISFLDALRDIGKHFSVNAMIQKESVRERLHAREQGISYTEFSYMLLQAHDFLHLRRAMDCTVQMAGSDQYGNITAGTDLIHKVMGGSTEAYGVTAPLVTKADGKKFGKTEQGAVWLSADRTSPYAFYQYWINTDDADVARYLRIFSRLPIEEVEAIVAEHEAEPHRRLAQKKLAESVTLMLHGPGELERVLQASEALFGGSVRGLDERTLAEVFAGVPHSDHAAVSLEGDGVPLVDLLPETSLASSKREAREFLRNGAVHVNGEKVAEDAVLRTADLLHGRTILLRRGKKHWHASRWS